MGNVVKSNGPCSSKKQNFCRSPTLYAGSLEVLIRDKKNAIHAWIFTHPDSLNNMIRTLFSKMHAWGMMMC